MLNLEPLGFSFLYKTWLKMENPARSFKETNLVFQLM